MSAKISAASKAARKDTAAIVPRNARVVRYFDSFELKNDLDEVDLFPTQANASALRANYERNPFSVNETTHITRIGFQPNASVIVITGADQAATAAAVAKFMNNFSNATVEFGRTGGTCFEQELAMKDYLSVEFDVQYLSATVANVHISTTPLVVLPQPIVLPPNETLKASVDFGIVDGLPASGTTVGLAASKLYMELHLEGFAYAPEKAAAVAAQIVAQADAAPSAIAEALQGYDGIKK